MGQIDEKSADRCRPVDIQKPAVNRIYKIAANGGAPDKEITDGQRKQLNNILNKRKSILKILAVKYLSLIHI